MSRILGQHTPFSRKAGSSGLGGAAACVIRLTLTASRVAIPLMIVLAAVGGAMPVIVASLQRDIFNGLLHSTTKPAAHLQDGGSGGASRIVLLAVLVGCAGLLSALTPYAQRYLETNLGRRIGFLIQQRVYMSVNSFPGLSRFESPTFSDKMQLVRQIGDSTSTQLITSVLGGCQAIITFVGFLVALESINPLLAALIGASSIPAVAIQISNSRRRGQLDVRKSAGLRRQLFYGRLLVDRDAVKEIRLFNLGDFFCRRMLDDLLALNHARRALDRRVLLLESMMSVLSAGLVATGLVWIVWQVQLDRASIGDITLLIMAMIGIQGAITNLVSMIATGYQSLLLFGHYRDVISMQPDLALADPPRQLPPLKHGIEFRDVWFRYDSRHSWVLQGVNLFIPFGGSLAIIGLNGAGKSTIVKLLCRFYDPQRGSIMWDGIDIRSVAPADLRSRIGTVFQDYMLYDLTAAENIGIGNLDQLDSRDQVRLAAEAAGIDQKLAGLPRGYETLLSRIFFDSKDKENEETGIVLSGGQWQRLAVARGLMRAERDLLILDEPSSGLDAEAEYRIHETLRGIRRGRTSILISHRLGSVRSADTICVISGGVLVEQGSHDELMACEGEYCRLFQLQARGYRDGDGSPLASTGTAERKRYPARSQA